MLAEILTEASKQGASDIHLRINSVRFRVNGELIPQSQFKVDMNNIFSIVAEVLKISEDEVRAIDKEFDKDISYSVTGVGRFRVNVAKQRGTFMMTLRIVNFDVPEWTELGVPKGLTEVLQSNKGLLLVTGPTGSGKSTTLAALIRLINETRDFNIVTIEDPIEYLHKDKKSIISQREVGVDTTFHNGLRAVLRQDPDVILIGELRDAETMEIALTAAETGHLVLSTLHTNSAVSSISRFLSEFPAEKHEQIRNQLSANLLGVFTQTLLKSTRGGRALAYELLVPNDAMRKNIREAKFLQIKQAMESSAQCISMKKSLEKLEAAKLITAQQKAEMLTIS